MVIVWFCVVDVRNVKYMYDQVCRNVIVCVGDHESDMLHVGFDSFTLNWHFSPTFLCGQTRLAAGLFRRSFASLTRMSPSARFGRSDTTSRTSPHLALFEFSTETQTAKPPRVV